jgi:hypothetical protein
MGKRNLARVLDPAVLDAAGGARARLRVRVRTAWLVEGAELAIVAPARLGCARCDGGGCDGCGRSGALEAPGAVEARSIRVHVPAVDGRAIALRLVRPFGDAAAVEQLVLELEPGEEADARVTRIELAPRAPGPLEGVAWGRAALVATCLALFALAAAAAALR